MAPPQWEFAVSPAGTLGAASTPYWVSTSERTMRQASTQVGKQYELDQPQTGEMYSTLDNRDGTWNPVNASSPYSPAVSAFRPARFRAQYPSTVQLLTGNQATMGDAGSLAAGTLASSTAMNLSTVDGAASVVVIGDAWQGTRAMQLTIPNATTANSPVLGALGVAVHPGKVHAFQCRIRCLSGTSPQLAARLSWRDSSGSLISNSVGATTTITSGSSTWVQLTVTGTPPANAVGVVPGVLVAVTTTGSCVTQHDGWQCELAAAPTTWVQPGTWYPVFYGGAERWPQTYEMGGTFGQTEPVVVDAFALLAGIYPPPPFYADVLALAPDFFFPLDDPTSSTVFRDAAGKYSPAPVANGPYGVGTVASGQSIQSAIPGGTIRGAPGPVVTMTNPNTGTANFEACSYIQLDKVGVAGPPTTGGWTRQIAFRNNGAGTTTGTLWYATNPSYQGTLQNLFYVALGATPSSGLVVEVISTTAGSVYSPPIGTWADNNWHLLHVVLSADSKTVTIYVDGNSVYTNTTGTSQSPTGIASDVIGAVVYPGVSQWYNGYNGDVAHVAQWSVPLTSTQIGNLYNAWRPAWSPEPSGQRYLRILTWAGYAGAQFIQGGNTQAMGPATDVDGKTDALTLLQNVVTTESGTHYITPDGTIRFEQRSSRYNQLTPVYTFGENTAGGEWPYEDVAFDYDPTHVIGQAQITQNSTGQVFVANAPTTLAPNYRPTYQRTINVVNPQECVDAATYLAYRYANPRLRVQRIRLHPAAVANMWPVALSLVISTRIRVMRRAPGQPAIQFDGFIENIKWEFDWDTGNHFVDLEVSPADLQLYWVNAALHTTLAAQANSGANTITLNALPDSATNPAAMSFCNGLQLTLDPANPALAETLTVQSVSATSPGYSTFTVTFTANLAHTHSVNAVVCEALPVGVTDPTAWDAAAICGVTTTPSY